MSIGFQCPGCQRPYSVDAALAGKRVRCKQCGNEMRVPTPSRPAAPKSKPKPPVPADVYGFDDELVEPMLAPTVMAESERPSRGSGGLFGSKSKKKRKRGSSAAGPWGVPLRWFVFFLFVTAGTVNGRIKAGVITPDMLPVVHYARIAATVLMVVSVVGALVSFLQGNRSAFRGESILGQIAWGWAILGLTLTQVMLWRVPTPGEPEPVPLARTALADMGVFERLIRDEIKELREIADLMDQVQPGPGEANALERLQAKHPDIESVHDRARMLPLPTDDQVRQLKQRCEGDLRAVIVRMREAAKAGTRRYPDGLAAADYFQMMDSNLSKFVSLYDEVFPPGSDHAGWYFAVFGNDVGGNRVDPSAPTSNTPEIPRELLTPPAPIVTRGPMITPPTGPAGPNPEIARPVAIQPPDFPLPGGPPSPPVMGPRPGFPGPPPRPHFPTPPRPHFPSPPGFGPPGR